MGTKTAAEVSDYLKKQKWVRKFAKNMKSVGNLSKESAYRVLAGECGARTILSGFHWAASPQGFDYWYNIHKEFQKFYYGKDR